ncbi:MULTISPECIES: hypothetical protein [unclassified Bacillus (in: firmicutes)]|uniref:hypothetical protein n=1 Tax=unclassified Bacillus (in: firmicutes) TaxID=185979 RepID=UPI0008E0A779|nr:MULTISPECIES: hypothetical protein [unclassified Bacillus (in: firmicutes)]SFB07186.1 hypothetical protein SAMN02799634_10578 [Bacillus sp. UNCCL13]SFQ87434.1 hypothetical protein SAMN04488577_3042 [Bacillus sp. cl95]
MKNFFLILLVGLIIASIAGIVLGYYKFGFGIGALAAFLAMSVGFLFSMDNHNYVHKSYHNDYTDRLKK